MRQNIPSSALTTFKKGDEVLAYREKTKKWVGRYKVKEVEDKMVTITKDSYTKKWNVQQLKPYKRAEREKSQEPWKSRKISHTEVLHTALKPFIPEESERSKFTPWVYLSEIIHRGDPRAKYFDKAKKKSSRV